MAIKKYMRGNTKLDPMISAIYKSIIKNGCNESDIRIKDVVDLFINEHGYNGNMDHLKNTVSAWLKNNVSNRDVDTSQIQHLPPDKNPGKTTYILTDGIYKMNCRKGSFEIPVSKMDEIFLDYSAHGRDQDLLTVRHKHGLELWQFFAIKSALNLYKEGHIFSPATTESMSPEEFQKHVEQKVAGLFDDKLAIVKNVFSKAKGNMYKKGIEERNKGIYRFTNMVDDLMEKLPKVTPLTPKTCYYPNTKNEVIEDLVVTIADLHIGADVKEACIKSEFNREIAKERLSEIANKANSMNAKRIHLAFLGDMMESFMGMMHKETYKETEQGMWGATLIEVCVDVLHDFISKVNNVSGVYFVGGNHDRATNEWNGDTRAEAGKIVFTFLKRQFQMLKSNVSLEWQNLAVKVDIGGMRYIFAHGDKRGNYRDKKNYFLDFGDLSKYNVLMTGHLHSRETGLDNHNRRWIQCPSVFSGNWHSKSMGYEAPPGFIMTYENRDGRLMVIDTTL